VRTRQEPDAQPAVPPAAPASAPLDPEAGTRSRACAVCHPAIYAEHMQNTHGAAFVDEEARLATRDFRRENCVRCHTPRPIYETGLGMVPMERRHDLEEGNTCMSCHGKAGYDYSHFHGGEECKVAFDDRVGTVESCATCHRVAATPEQWEHAAKGKRAGWVCIDCHMPMVERPVAVGMPPRRVRSHVFPASRSESQLRRAYRYDARIEGNEVVVRITNAGAGHNFPTGSIQRSLESLVVIRDALGHEVSTSRAVLKVPYFKPTGLDLPRSAQIPSGQSREHRVPIPAASGSAECRLFFKRYYPIEDGHPTLSRRLECRTLRFADITPSTHVAQPPAGAPPGLPEVTPLDAARPDGLAKYAHLPPGTPTVTIPEGDSPADLERLVAILEFPVPGARVQARRRLAELGAAAVPTLVQALGHWSDETRDQAMELLLEIGEPAMAAVEGALGDDRLYVRYHARMVLSRMTLPDAVRTEVRETLVRDLARPHPLDRRSAADALGRLGDPDAAPALRPLLEDPDWDVVAAAAQALGLLDDRGSVPAMEAALRRATFPESRRDLAAALAALGSAAGTPVLLEGLDYPDDLIRRSVFDAFFDATGLHESYDPDAPRPQRLEALARLQSAWAQGGGPSSLGHPKPANAAEEERAWRMVEALGGGTDTLPGGDDVALLRDLVAMGEAATPALVQALSFPPGWMDKRALACEALGRIGDPRAAPYLVRALRDPNLPVASWACWALSTTGDKAALPALHDWSRRLAALADTPQRGAGPEPLGLLLARAAWTRAQLGDETASTEIDAHGSAPELVSSCPPSRARIATTEAPPVLVPTSPADAVAKAQALRAQDFYEDAIRVLRDADARFGPTAGVHLETAWNLLMIGEEDMTRDAPQATIDAEVALARSAFEETLRMDPRIAGQELLQAKLLRYEGSLLQARMLLSGIVERDPDDADAHREYADFAFAMSDWGVAEREYGALARLHPQDGWPLLYATISAQWAERPPNELEEGYLAAARLLPEEPLPLVRLSTLYAESPARNIALLERAIADRPGAVQARVQLARLLRSQPEPDLGRAERLLVEALMVSARSMSAHLELAGLYEAGGRIADAVLQDLDALAVADKAGIAEAAEDLARVLRGAAETDAIPPGLRTRAWDAIVARGPSSGRYAHDAGIWYLDVGHEPSTAARYLAAAVAAQPHDAACRQDLDRARAAEAASG